MASQYDFLVIGGGSAGYAAARTALEFTDKVAVVDGADPLGGLCILRGCMPSKTLIYSAEVLHLAQRGTEFGLKIDGAEADMAAIHARKVRTIAEFAEYRQGQLQDGRFDLHRSRARFAGPREVVLDDGTVLGAEKILIASGSVVNRPPVDGLDLPGIWTSDDVLELSSVPESVIVLGGGSVACELAQFLRRVGSRVVQIQRSEHILTGVAAEAAEVVEEAFRDEGMELFTGTRLLRVEAEGSGFAVVFEHGGQELRREAAHLFNGLGRKPNIAPLDLPKAGVLVKESGHVETDENQETNISGIYAAGDVAGPHEIVHVAIQQGEIAAQHAFGREVAPVDSDSLVTVVFTDPQVAYVGPPAEAFAARGIECVSASYPFDDHGKSILMEAKRGYVKTWVEKKTGRLRAAECVGRDASELIHSMAVAVSLQATARDLLKAHWYHPTLSEIWTYPLEDCVDEIQSS